jgi:hypothetical protein
VRTEERFRRQHDTGQFITTHFGREVTKLFLKPLADIIAAKLNPPKNSPFAKLAKLPRGELRATLKELKRFNPETLALMTLAPVLNAIDRPPKSKKRSPEMLFKKQIGEEFYARLELKQLSKPERKMIRRGLKGLTTRRRAIKFLKWNMDPIECTRIGEWLMGCVAELDAFAYDGGGVLVYAPKHLPTVLRLREELMWRDPVLMPHLTPPPDWTSWEAKYDERLSATFVRDWRPETREAITAAFRDGRGVDDTGAPIRLPSPFRAQHVAAVNALQRVPLLVDQFMVDMVERHVSEIVPTVEKTRDAEGRTAPERDIITARWIGNQTFYLTYNCDRRGRVYAIPHFNYQREDHIRALFRFANGMKLRAPPHPKSEMIGDLEMLEIHCANCFGFDKESWQERINWAKENREFIEKIAAVPDDTVDEWGKADAPFAFLAACRELAAAWADPASFVTRLPIGFDGTANGLQHLAAICRDEHAGEMTNLVPGKKYQDAYSHVIERVKLDLAADNSELAEWWHTRLKDDPTKARKLLKSPAMTFSYSATEWGMAAQINKVYSDLYDGATESTARFMAEKVQAACEKVLPKLAELMHYIRDLTDHCTRQNVFLEWDSPSGFPCSNRYQPPKCKRIEMLSGVRHKIAVGVEPKINSKKARNASAPNFVHSLDAAHLVRTVNAVGGTDILAVHDSFACLAPRATKLSQVLRTEFGVMHIYYDALEVLHEFAPDANIPPPAIGWLDLLGVQETENSFI